jgi:hypothetical protein
MPTDMDQGMGGGGGGDGGKRQGLIAVNDLTYVLEPDLSVAVNRTHKRHFFQSNKYTQNQRGICILNSGADYIDTRRSFLSFTCAITSPEDVSGSFGTHGSACNLINNITISTRSGDELCRLVDFPALSNIMQPLTYTKSWYENQGRMMGYQDIVGAKRSQGVINNGDVPEYGNRFCIPMYLLAPLFGYGRLMPAMLMSGLRIEIEWNTSQKAFVGIEVGGIAVKPFVPGTISASPIERPGLERDPRREVTGYEITDAYFSLCSVQLSDSIQRALNEQSATNGLEIVYCDYEKTETQGASGTNLTDLFHVEVRKSCSRALKAFARVKFLSAIQNEEGKRDVYRAESGFPVLEYQWQLGSLYFPQQPVKATGNNANTAASETYAHLLEAVDKFHGNAVSPALTFRGDLPNSAAVIRSSMNSGKSQSIPASLVTNVEDSQGLPFYQPGVDFFNYRNPYGHVGSFINDQHAIGVTLERSTMFNLAGVPVNNSRVLALRTRLSAETNEFRAPSGGAGDKRSLDIYLKYVKLARVFLNNVEVEQ